jgi:hypothetical protein
MGIVILKLQALESAGELFFFRLFGLTFFFGSSFGKEAIFKQTIWYGYDFMVSLELFNKHYQTCPYS